MMPVDRPAARRSKLLQSLRAAKLDALLVTNPINVTYLTGFTGDSSFLLIGPRQTVLFSDSRFETQLQDECPGLEVNIRTSKTQMGEVLTRELPKLGLKSLGIESASMTVAIRDHLAEKLSGLPLSPQASLVEDLRQIKDADEIQEIRTAVRQAEQGFQLLRALLKPEMTEREAANELEHAMRRFGALRAAFEPIVGVGPRSALPHGRPSGVQLSEAGFVLFDWGAVSSRGYHSDLTRVLPTGKLPPKLEKVYRVVLNAQEAAIAGIRPGRPAVEVDAIARKVIEDAGYGKYFGHGLGHGIGLQIHEEPRMSPISRDVFRPGMVVTVEPGIYLPGVGGVRIEDDILITRDGCEVLSSVPKALESLT